MNTTRRKRLAAAALSTLVIAVITTAGLASDHQDTPEVELEQTMDINDVYAFPGSSPDRIALVLTTASPITPGRNLGFNPNLLYQFKIDNTGDAVEDRVIQVTFTGSAGSQQVRVRGPVAPEQTGTMNTLFDGGPTIEGPVNAIIGSAPSVQVFAGLREDPFFLDLERFFRILPDRKPVTGQLSQLPDVPTATSWRNPGVDYLAGLNTLAIVIELPIAQVTAGGSAKIGVWGTISR